MRFARLNLDRFSELRGTYRVPKTHDCLIKDGFDKISWLHNLEITAWRH